MKLFEIETVFGKRRYKEDDVIFYDEVNKELYHYWTDKKNVFWRYDIMERANPKEFIVFNRHFAKDNKYCYMHNNVIKGANAKEFIGLNNSFAKDDKNVWSLGGKIKGVDIETFNVCDDGFLKDSRLNKSIFNDGIEREMESYLTYGYAKDKNNVYCENGKGKTKIVRKADPKTFKSMNLGNYGYDDNFVFFQSNVIQKANPKTWKILDYNKNSRYSKDDKNVFFTNKLVKGADVKTFEIFDRFYGKDKNNYYRGNEIIAFEQIE